MLYMPCRTQLDRSYVFHVSKNKPGQKKKHVSTATGHDSTDSSFVPRPSSALVLGQFSPRGLHLLQEAPAVDLHHAVLADGVAVGARSIAFMPLEPVDRPAFSELDLGHDFDMKGKNRRKKEPTSSGEDKRYYLPRSAASCALFFFLGKRERRRDRDVDRDRDREKCARFVLAVPPRSPSTT